VRRIKLVVIASALILAGCSSTTSSSEGPENGGLLSDGTGTGDALTDVAVSDSFSPLTLVPVSTGTFPFLGTDDKYHVAYDLQLTNASRVPGTLEKIDVVDAHDSKNVVASFSGMQLVDPNCPFGDCNRLRLLPSANASDIVIPPQESRALLLDFAFDTLAESPKAVIHHLYGTGALTPAGGDPKPINYLAAPLDISAGTPRVIRPPLKGTNWIALNGCCEPGFPHRTSLNSAVT